ncbi:sulfotransferase [Microbulbifer sp. EKSA005]|uniref:sulfotransferase n=1 Tax=Microbulbifer sp. EKSA005 TaxID=3243364 RepID=UPI004042044E
MNPNILINKGVDVLTPSSQKGSRTIITVGVARGGTSIVAGALHALGLPMGDKCYSPVFEDLRLSLAFERRSDEHFTEVVAQYNKAHSSWGWKRPSILNHLDFIESKLRNPHFIFVFRDIFSVANRNSISMKTDVKCGLQEALDNYRLMVEFLQKTNSPAMLVSSDKVVRHKEEFVERLIDFVGVEVSSLQRENAINFISPDPKDYLDKTRITKSRGAVNIDLLKTGLLRGWARGVHHLKPVTIEVEVNGKKVGTTEANIYREHLDKPSIHPTGKCGYELDLKVLGVTPSDTINVRVQDDVNPLNSRPIQHQHLERWLTLKEWHEQD